MLLFWAALIPRTGISAKPEPSAGQIAVYTMGSGDDIFAHFGHSAICAGEWCYNWGTADFSTPVPLTYDFIRGRARFWVSKIPVEPMLRYYVAEDRTVWRQTLPLTSTEAATLARTLEGSTAEAVKYYRYHHFEDNCTTRIRDIVDGALGGALKDLSQRTEPGLTYRGYARIGFRGYPGLLIVANLALGRAADHPTTAWERMFLPEELRDALEKAIGSKPEVLYQRRGPPPAGAIWAGDAMLTVIGIALALLIFLARRTGPRTFRAAVSMAGILLGLIGLFLWTLALASAFSELVYNEVLLILWPLDLGLPVLKGRLRFQYVRVRLLVIAIVFLLRLVGIFIQPLWPALILAGAPWAMVTFLNDDLPRMRARSRDSG
jgi:hypothetical protein